VLFSRPRILLAFLTAAVALPAPARALSLPLPLPLDVAPVVGPALSGMPSVAAGSDSALVSASIVPGAAATSWAIQYGTGTGYGSTTTTVTLPAGTAPVAVSASLGDLVADATYHYRFAFTSALMTTYTPDATFATSSAVVTLSDPGLDTGTEAEGHQDPPSSAPAGSTTAAPSTAAPAQQQATPPATTAPASTPAARTGATAAVSARLTTATATRTAVRLILRTTAPTTVRVTVKPAGGRATTKTYTSVAAGTRAFTIPARVRTAATVTVVATDRAGNTVRITRRIRPLHGPSHRA
jgi:hypothetical protein